MSGFHSARVVDACDPYGEARLKIRVPGVLGDRVVWAWPMVRDSRIGPPAEGAGVWVWFEQGDPDRALWMGSASH